MGVLALQAAGVLEVWHLYVAAAVTGACACFQWPAFSASISLMVPAEHLGRANGMLSLVESGPGVLAPLLAGALLPIISLTGILLIDVVTFILAVGALLVVRVPQPARPDAAQSDAGGLRDQLLFGLRYILARPGLLAIQLVFLFGNLASAMGFTVLAPMVLTRTGQNETTLGLVLGIGAAMLVTPIMSALLYGVAPTDPVTYAGVAIVLGAVTLLATYLPARRASRVQPIIALRSQ